MALYGYHPLPITSYLRENYKVQVVEDHIGHQQQALQLSKDNLNLAQNRMKQQEYKHHRERSYESFTEKRTRQLRNRSISKYLRKGKNLPVEGSTWEVRTLYRSIKK